MFVLLRNKKNKKEKKKNNSKRKKEREKKNNKRRKKTKKKKESPLLGRLRNECEINVFILKTEISQPVQSLPDKKVVCAKKNQNPASGSSRDGCVATNENLLPKKLSCLASPLLGDPQSLWRNLERNLVASPFEGDLSSWGQKVVFLNPILDTNDDPTGSFFESYSVSECRSYQNDGFASLSERKVDPIPQTNINNGGFFS